MNVSVTLTFHFSVSVISFVLSFPPHIPQVSFTHHDVDSWAQLYKHILSLFVSFSPIRQFAET